MFSDFHTYIQKNTRLNEEEIQLMLSTATKRTLRKNEVLLHEGDICRHKAFVVKGLLRGYRVTEDGTEHLIWFSSRYWWTLEPDSYHHQTPSDYIIDALEESELILWSKDAFDELLAQIPDLKIFSDQLVSRNLSITRERVFQSLSATAEEKYDAFVKTHPEIFARVPLHMVASYLGVSRKTITRIRRAQLGR